MIKTALVAMTIVGCDCDAKLCEYIGETPAQWATVADCEAAMKHRILHAGNHDYPLVSGICRTSESLDPQSVSVESAAVGAAGAALPAGMARRPEVPVGRQAGAADGPHLYETVLDGGRAALYRTKDGYALIKDGVGRTAGDALAAVRRSTDWLGARVSDGF